MILLPTCNHLPTGRISEFSASFLRTSAGLRFLKLSSRSLPPASQPESRSVCASSDLTEHTVVRCFSTLTMTVASSSDTSTHFFQTTDLPVDNLHGHHHANPESCLFGRVSLLWDVKWRRLVVGYRPFGTTYRFHLRSITSQKNESFNDAAAETWNLPYWTLCELSTKSLTKHYIGTWHTHMRMAEGGSWNVMEAHRGSCTHLPQQQMEARG